MFGVRGILPVAYESIQGPWIRPGLLQAVTCCSCLAVQQLDEELVQAGALHDAAHLPLQQLPVRAGRDAELDTADCAAPADLQYQSWNQRLGWHKDKSARWAASVHSQTLTDDRLPTMRLLAAACMQTVRVCHLFVQAYPESPLIQSVSPLAGRASVETAPG